MPQTMAAQRSNDTHNSSNFDAPEPAQFHLRDLFVLITACAAALGVARAVLAPLQVRIALGGYLLFCVAYVFFRARRWRRALLRWTQARKRRAELEQWLRERRSGGRQGKRD